MELTITNKALINAAAVPTVNNVFPLKRRPITLERTSPIRTNGASTAPPKTWLASNDPPTHSAARETTLPRAEYALIVARSVDGGTRRITIANGGPPILVAVPNTPEIAPATTKFRPWGRGDQPRELSATPPRTATPTKRDIYIGANAETAIAPKAVPGSRPTRTHPKYRQLTDPHSLIRTKSDVKNARRITVAGNRSGRSRASTGAPIIPRPKPTAP